MAEDEKGLGKRLPRGRGLGGAEALGQNGEGAVQVGGFQEPEPDVLEAGGLTLHLTRGTASAGDKSVELTRNELRILAHLMGNQGKIVSRADLIDALWDSQIYIDDNTLSVNMTRLRAKLEGIGLPGLIKTRRGMGYQL